MKNIKITILILSVIAIAIVSFFITTKTRPATAPGPVACTEEAKLCPDGSYVSRTGPQCQFSDCPTNTKATTTQISTSTSTPKASGGVRGTVLLGPSCPVMRNPPDPQCADKPYQSTFVITTLGGNRVIKSFSSDIAGKFKVNLPPGEYSIRSASTNNIYPRCSSNDVTVRVGIFTDIPISCDTGIR